MVTVVIVIVARDTQVTRYTGHMTAQSISASLPYYNAPVIRQLDANTVKEFIATCKEDGLSGVLGIFPETTTTGMCDHVIQIMWCINALGIFWSGKKLVNRKQSIKF